MGTKTRGLTMARASKEDLKGLQLFKELLDRLEEVEDHWTFNECFPTDDYPELRRALYFRCQNGKDPVDWLNLLNSINDVFLTGWFRVVFGYEVLIDNCQNKENEDSLDFNAKIQAGFAALEILEDVMKWLQGCSYDYPDDTPAGKIKRIKEVLDMLPSETVLDSARTDNTDSRTDNEKEVSDEA